MLKTHKLESSICDHLCPRLWHRAKFWCLDCRNFIQFMWKSHADSFCETFRLSDLTDSLRQGLRARHFTHSEGRWTQVNSWQTWSTLHFLVENIHPQVVPKWYELILYKFLCVCVCLFIHCCSIYLGQYYESFWTKFGTTAPNIILGSNASSPNAQASFNWAVFKSPLLFHYLNYTVYTGWLIGIPLLDYYNPRYIG